MNNINTLAICEQFLSIQGEGHTGGHPAYFLRLAGCNLLCGGAKQLENGATWTCDSIKVWQRGERHDFKDTICKLGGDKFIKDMRNQVHLVITGGEPMLQQDGITNFILWFQLAYGFLPIIEIETNGTIEPNLQMKSLVTYWNVSPKLANSGEPAERRINKIAIAGFSILGARTMFKFVVSNSNNWDEISEDYMPYISDHRQIWLMPACDNVDDLITISFNVAEMCIKNRVKFSNRLQIMVWNKTTGV